MIKKEKKYLMMIVISIFYFVFLKSIDLISDVHFKLDKQEISELHKSAQNNNLTAIRKLTNFYYFIENDRNEVANIYRKYKDVNPKVKMALYYFLKSNDNIKRHKDETVTILTELAKDGNIQAQQSLEKLYRFGAISLSTKEVFVEQDIQKAEYWANVIRCREQGGNNQKCLELK
jgi:TPR repeat protein